MASLVLLGLVGALAPLSSIDHDSSVHGPCGGPRCDSDLGLQLRSRRGDGVLLMRIRHRRFRKISSVLLAASSKPRPRLAVFGFARASQTPALVHSTAVIGCLQQSWETALQKELWQLSSSLGLKAAV